MKPRMIAIRPILVAPALSMGAASAGAADHPVVLTLHSQPGIGKLVQARVQARGRVYHRSN